MKKLYIISLYGITVAAFAAAGSQAFLEEKRELKDATLRSASLLAGIEDSIRTYHLTQRYDRINGLVKRLRAHERVSGLALCTPEGKALSFPDRGNWDYLCSHPNVLTASSQNESSVWEAEIGSSRYRFYSQPMSLASIDDDPATLVLTQDLSYLKGQWTSTFLRTLAIAWITGALILLLIATQFRRWIKEYLKNLHHTLKALGAGKHPPRTLMELNQDLPEPADLAPISRDLDRLAAKILTLPQQSREEGQTPPKQEQSWLSSLRETIGTHQVTIFANREPYIHQRKGDRIEVTRPASGLVTALEPILRHAGGLWIAHGSGSADRETANSDGELAVPPNNPRYTLKRIWLTKEEEEGYYYGFSNEGLWPLCHLAHTRPTFRLTDWEKYGTVNQRFCDETPQSALSDNSLILVQDYHFALLPRMLKERAAKLENNGTGPKIGLFWHIPWPNPEAFGISPWNKELLKGMLGANVIGFHTQYHCNNFLETCDRYLEARIDWEKFSVTMENHETLVRAFPIGIETPSVNAISDDEKAKLKERYGIKADLVAVGVDRIDYTKGLIERVEGVERFLEKYPHYVGRFTLAQMGSPSRTHIPAYRQLAEQLQEVVNRVNTRFGNSSGYLPVKLIAEHHEWDDIQYFYQLGDVCMVTSLHDGMNLVAKEYVWCQQPTQGSLILSRFTGASRELTDAFIVNPYSTEEIADAIAASLMLPPEEKGRRMLAMKEKIESHNAFHWASDLIRTLVTEVKIPESETPMIAPTSISASNSGLTSVGRNAATGRIRVGMR